MSIKIKTEKVVNKDGIAARKIVSIEGVLGKDALPSKYLENKPFVTTGVHSGILINGVDGHDLFVGREISEDGFQTSLDFIRKAGEHLHNINSIIRKLREEWKGEEIFVI